jgi:amidase
MRYLFLIAGLQFFFSVKAQVSQPATDSASRLKFIEFVPVSFSNLFSANIPAVLSVRAGDTVSTETIDARGYDKNNIKRQKAGNPLTGPFYIENAMPGDAIAIELIKVSLNRATAFTTENFVSRSLPKNLLQELKKPKLVNWKLDTVGGFATIDDTAYEHLQLFKVPLHPFVGCIGVAPANKRNEVLSFFQGSYGGNLDFSSITQSATVYLPVFHEGGYLYIGDGHALQGDGEIAGNALETSLHVAFTVKLIKKELLSITQPRVEDSIYIMSVGTGKSLDGAIKIATAGLLEWVQMDYHLTLPEATQVLSTSVEFIIAEIADPEVEVVAKIKKKILSGLKKYN